MNEPSIHAQDKKDELGLDPKTGLIRFLLDGREITASVAEENGKHYLRLQTAMFRMFRIQPLSGGEILISVVGGSDD